MLRVIGVLDVRSLAERTPKNDIGRGAVPGVTARTGKKFHATPIITDYKFPMKIFQTQGLESHPCFAQESQKMGQDSAILMQECTKTAQEFQPARVIWLQAVDLSSAGVFRWR